MENTGYVPHVQESETERVSWRARLDHALPADAIRASACVASHSSPFARCMRAASRSAREHDQVGRFAVAVSHRAGQLDAVLGCRRRGVYVAAPKLGFGAARKNHPDRKPFAHVAVDRENARLLELPQGVVEAPRSGVSAGWST